MALAFGMATRQGISFDDLLDKLIVNAAALENAAQPVELDDGELQMAAKRMLCVAPEVRDGKTMLVALRMLLSTRQNIRE